MGSGAGLRIGSCFVLSRGVGVCGGEGGDGDAGVALGVQWSTGSTG